MILEPLKKNLVASLESLSPPDFFGPSCLGSVVVWSIAKREAVCGSPAAGLNVGNATTVLFSKCRDEMFITAGKYVPALRVFRTRSKVVPTWGNPVPVLRKYLTS